MCSVVGALVWDIDSEVKRNAVNKILSHIMKESHARGRDGMGYLIRSTGCPPYIKKIIEKEDIENHLPINGDYLTIDDYSNFIGNFRAEPTTEYVHCKNKYDQQPYTCGKWNIVHNGTIANDKELRTNKCSTSIDSATIPELLDISRITETNTFQQFYSCVTMVKGSYAIIGTKTGEDNHIMVAVNYRPVWFIRTDDGIFFASSRDYFPSGHFPTMLEPYKAYNFEHYNGELTIKSKSLYKKVSGKKKALVVCSGGLDSVVAATIAKKWLNYEVTLLHFKYGCNAEGREVEAVQDVARALNVPLKLFPLPIYNKDDSPLFNAEGIAGGEEGAEFAHEWVPARNLVLLSVATAYAEANGFSKLVLGNNLEEAGAYPDNEPEFIHRFNDILPLAVGDGKQLEVLMPLGNLMKHEVVATGMHLSAPLSKTWSCYHNGESHCGKCGPCFMRKTAFDINNFKEVIEYDT